MFCTARRREAADTHLFPGGVDPQEVVEQRRLVPVEELREAVVDGTASAARQWKDPLGHTTDALADVDPGPRAAPVRSRVAWPCTRPPRQALSRAILCRRRAGGHTACCRSPQSRVADEVVLGDAVQMHLRYPVRGARVGSRLPCRRPRSARSRTRCPRGSACPSAGAWACPLPGRSSTRPARDPAPRLYPCRYG